VQENRLIAAQESQHNVESHGGFSFLERWRHGGFPPNATMSPRYPGFWTRAAWQLMSSLRDVPMVSPPRSENAVNASQYRFCFTPRNPVVMEERFAPMLS
jgi:hypothetical protein